MIIILLLIAILAAILFPALMVELIVIGIALWLAFWVLGIVITLLVLFWVPISMVLGWAFSALSVVVLGIMVGRKLNEWNDKIFPVKRTNMNKLLIAIATMLVWAGTSQAAPSFHVQPDVSASCHGESKFGCLVESTQSIYISSNLTPAGFAFVFYHEYGHYLIQGHEKEAARIFGSEESAADGFWLYVIVPAGLSKEQHEFYTNLLIK
jgi:hypothetical protein